MFADPKQKWKMSKFKVSVQCYNAALSLPPNCLWFDQNLAVCQGLWPPSTSTRPSCSVPVFFPREVEKKPLASTFFSGSLSHLWERALLGALPCLAGRPTVSLRFQPRRPRCKTRPPTARLGQERPSLESLNSAMSGNLVRVMMPSKSVSEAKRLSVTCFVVGFKWASNDAKRIKKLSNQWRIQEV